jgi:uncharacterized repeat protein (TIGR03833 family)
MPVTPRSQVGPGALVSIVLPADQATGRQVQGTVREVLRNHSDHGTEVLLTDGRIGHVREVLHDGSGPQHPFVQPQPHNSAVPSPENWQTHTTYPSGHPSPHSPHAMMLEPPDPQSWQAHTASPSGRLSPHRQQGHSPVPDPHNWSAHTTVPSSHIQLPAQQQRPNHAHPHTSHTPLLDDTPQIPRGERSEQIEYLQSYESSKPESEDDRNQATLRREFPNIDSSLIAAIYSDSKSLGATREMLQELRD